MTDHSLGPDGTGLRLPADARGPASAAAMPGWHIFADLTPPELMASRRVRSLRAWVVVALVVVLGGVGFAYDHARGQAAEAAAAVTAEEATGQALRDQQQQFAGVMSLQAAVDRARQDLAALLASDVDIDALLGKLWAALPDGMTINQIAVTVPDQVSGKDTGRSSSDGAASLDTSEAAHIGTVTLAGTGTAIDDVPAFIDNLSAIDGVYSPFPTSNQRSEESTSYSLQFTLTDALLTHRYAAEGEN